MQTERYAHVPKRIAGLVELAHNLWWSWNPEARDLFRRLDLQTYRRTGHNPVEMLSTLPEGVLTRAAGDANFLALYDAVLERFRRDLQSGGTWFDRTYGDTSNPVVYMSAEFGVHVSLPVYAGGLGILAGDTLKECSDLGVPMIGVGLIYSRAYVWQRIREDGWQEDVEQTLDRTHNPVLPAMDSDGHPLIVTVPAFNPRLQVAVWRAMIGRVPLYLMSSDVEGNQPWDRAIAHDMYASDLEQRLRQEIVLGMGGMRVLDAMGVTPGVLHLNDGHPALAILERLRARLASGDSWDAAIREIRNTTVFTTHTPVPAGTDVFPFALVQKYLQHYCEDNAIDPERLLALGVNPADPQAGFNMTVFALRMSRYCNAVSKRHSEVARRMWSDVRLPEQGLEEIIPITNGVHLPTWIEPLRIQTMLGQAMGPGWRDVQDRRETWEAVEKVPDEELWQLHNERKATLLARIDGRARRNWHSGQFTAANIVASGALLEPDVLTLGFARRFTAYKRPDLILHDTERLKRLLTDPWRPIQLIFTGKAHPADTDGKRILQRIYRLALDPACAGRIAFIENYDQHLAKYLVAGVDVWLNNPIPPLEASGTSGIKASVNGVPHLSILDGWWPEGYSGDNGWAFGDPRSEEDRSPEDAQALYELLEGTIIPAYYDRGHDGVPHAFVRVMKEAIRSVGPDFNARRMMKEYTAHFYAPALRLETPEG